MVRKKKNQGAVWISTGLTHKGFTESATHGTVQKLATFFKNVIFEKLESQFTIIQNTDIVN